MLLIVILVVAGFPSALLAAPVSKMAPGDRERVTQAVTQVGAVVAGRSGPRRAPGVSVGKGTPPPASGEFVTHSASGVSFSAPDNWEVTTDGDDIFELALPGEFVFGFLSQESADEFPGIFAIVFFEQQPDLLAASMGEEIILQELIRFETDQGLPGLMIRFGGDMSGLDMTGSMYLVAAGDVSYMLMVLAENDVWETIQPEADAMAISLAADNPTTLTSAGADGLAYTTGDGMASLVLPADWQIQELEDEDIPVMLVNPEMTFVAAGLWKPIDTMANANDLALYNALLSNVAGSEDEAAVMDLLIESMNMGTGKDEIVIDQAASALFDDVDPPVLRIGGTILSDEMAMPMMAYVQAREDGLVGFLALGNIDDALDAEETILEILGSVVLESGK
jgi:hypothetical protein